MKLAAILDVIIGAGLGWLTLGWIGAPITPDSWLTFGIGLLAAVMLTSGAGLLLGAAWGQRLGRASSLAGLLVGGASLIVGSVLLIGGDRQDAGSGAAKAALGVVLLLVFAFAYGVHRTPSRESG